MATERGAGRRPLYILFSYKNVCKCCTPSHSCGLGEHLGRSQCVAPLTMFNFVFASHVLPLFSVSLGFVFSKTFWRLLFDLVMGVSVYCVAGETGVRVLHSPS